MLVLDTQILKDFCETLATVGLSHGAKIIRFVNEVLKNTNAYEQKSEKKEREIECLMRSIDELTEKEESDGQSERPTFYRDSGGD